MPSSQRKPKKLSEAEIITIIAGAVALDKSPDATAATLSPLIGVPVAALKAVLLIAMSRGVRYAVTVLPSATASAESQGQEPHYRALYIWNAVGRVLNATNHKEALAQEKNYFKLHLQAVAKRRASAAAVDKAASRYGDELGWYTVMDSRTSPECREANNKNFTVSRIPEIGYPGAVHPFCRCKPGRRHNTSQTVYSITAKGAA